MKTLPRLNFLVKVLVYHNWWLAGLGAFSYGLFSIWVGYEFSPLYATLVFSCIHVTYGLDNLLDQPEDSLSWKQEYLRKYPVLARVLNQVFVGFFFLLGIFSVVKMVTSYASSYQVILIDIWMVSVFLFMGCSVFWIHYSDFLELSNYQTQRFFAPWNIRKAPFFKTFFVAFVWWLFLLGIPLYIHTKDFVPYLFNHDILISVLTLALFCFSYFKTLCIAVWFSQYRDQHKDRLYKKPTIVHKHRMQHLSLLKIGKGVCFILFVFSFSLIIWYCWNHEEFVTQEALQWLPFSNTILILIVLSCHQIYMYYTLSTWDFSKTSLKKDMLLDFFVVYP